MKSKREKGSVRSGPRAARLAALVDLCLPRGLSNPDDLQRSRLVVRVTLMALGVCSLMQLKYVIEGAVQLACIGALSSVLQICSLIVHRASGSYRAGAHGFCAALWTLFFGISALSGGIDSPNLVANAFLVVVAPMLLGRRAGLFWLGAALLTPVAQLLLTQHGLVAAQALPLDQLRAARLGEYIPTFTTVALTAYFYRRGHDRMALELAAEKHSLDTANQELRVILDNAGQGFLSLDASGCIMGEYSTAISAWFQRPQEGQSFAAFLEPFSPESAASFRLGWEQIEARALPLELILEQLPDRFVVAERCFRLEYRTVNLEAESFEKVVVIVSDISAQLANEQARGRQGDILEGFERILRDPEGFQGFLNNARHAVGALEAGAASQSETWRCLHTLKGNSAMMGLSVLAEQCHRLEDELADTSLLRRASIAALAHELALVEGRLGPLLRTRSSGEVSLRAAEYQTFLHQVMAEQPHSELLGQVRSWELERVENHLGRLRDYARTLCERLGKGPSSIKTIDNGLRSGSELSEFWNVLVHVVRNAVDHGIESREERRRHGKEAPSIELRAALAGGHTFVEIADDGRGIDWQRVRERARELGMSADSEQELLAALWADGVSTSRDASDISGRGVGLSSVLRVCESLGIRTQVESRPHVGTTFRFTLPENAAVSSTQLRLPSASQSELAVGTGRAR